MQLLTINEIMKYVFYFDTWYYPAICKMFVNDSWE